MKIEPAPQKLGVVLPGMGAVSSTFIAGVEAIKKGLAKPIGSLTQMGTIRLGKRTEGRNPAIKDFVPLVSVDNLVFGGWDIFSDNIYQAGVKAGVLERSLLDQIRPELESISPWPAAFDKSYVKKLDGTNVKKAANKMELAEQIQDDIKSFQQRNNLTRTVMVWCGSTEIFLKTEAVHQTLESFEQGMRKNDPAIAPSMLYAYAAIKSGIAYANGAPNLSGDIPALMQLAKDRNVPIMGKDFKTGQTLMKTILAPGLKARLLGLNGWFSTNILGNRDGEVLDDPDSFKTKEESKLSVLEHILQPKLYPDLYSNYTHKVRINYYPPRGDNKEG
jgi:myo-inositol-1-phosphate synthase